VIVLADRTKSEHPPEALMHAYMAGEVDPAQRSVISQHIAGCLTCQAAQERVARVLRLMESMTPPDLDELRWRRIASGAMSRLEQDARRPRPRFGLDAVLVLRWAAIAAMVVAAFVGGSLVFRSTGKEIAQVEPIAVVPAEPATRGAEPPPHTITTGVTPFSMVLESGLALRLAPHTRVLMRSTVAPEMELGLEFGEVDLEMKAPVAPDDSITVTTPVFLTKARSTDFSVGFQATRFFVAVRAGTAIVQGDSLEQPIVVQQGEQRALKLSGARWELADSSRESVSVDTPTTHTKSRVMRSLRVDPTPVTPIDPSRLDPAPVLEPEQPPPSPIRITQEGETSVQVVRPPEGALAAKWREASEAYYETGDLDRAIALATEVARQGHGQVEATLAEDLLCEAYLKKRQPERAIGACATLASQDPDEAHVRAIHYRIATIYRTQLHDCRSAIPHYTQSMVFGGRSLNDDEALIWRASCALDLGSLESASADIAMLQRRAATLARPAALVELQKRLIAMSQRDKAPHMNAPAP
jgi:hypothetical protein